MEAFLGQQPGTDTVPAAAVPVHRHDLAGLPPAFIGVGSIDLFVDENTEYARRITWIRFLLHTGRGVEVFHRRENGGTEACIYWWVVSEA